MRRTLILLVLAVLVAGLVLDLYYNGIPGVFGSLIELLDPVSEGTTRIM